jgi:hypothetical protein
MPIKFLRFKPGAGGDTILKLILTSNLHVKSQIAYVGLASGKTVLDMDALQNFRYLHIALLSLNPYEIDKETLQNQLLHLQDENINQQWLLKSHYYEDLEYPMVDILITKNMLPFAVKGVTLKNINDPTRHNTLKNYNFLIPKIKDKKILHYFNCYNVALDIINAEKNRFKNEKILLEDILGGWESLVESLKKVNMPIAEECKPYYDQWITNNKQYKPSINYLDLVIANNFDYNHPELDIEERYCLLALAEQKFKIL